MPQTYMSHSYIHIPYYFRTRYCKGYLRFKNERFLIKYILFFLYCLCIRKQYLISLRFIVKEKSLQKRDKRP